MIHIQKELAANSALLPTNIVIFGGTGDLAKRKLFSALLDLYANGALPNYFKVLGVSRKELSQSDYQTFVGASLENKNHKYTTELITEFCQHFEYCAGNFDDPKTYQTISETLKQFDTEVGQCCSKLFYLAVPPQLYGGIFKYLDEAKLMELCDEVYSWSRILVEKPFGEDLETAQALEQDLCARFTEEQIYRIDHYLAKDSIENIIALRFANTVLSDSWHAGQIESIRIRLFEKNDVASRGSFYDGIGALRDVGQNHVLQILALLTMTPLDITTVKSIRSARAEVLENLLPPKKIIKGQYKGYTETSGVSASSTTETFFRLETELSNTRWAGVPIILEAGKSLNQNINDVVITFRPQVNWQKVNEPHVKDHRNILTIQFSPEQRITLTVWVKKPGFAFSLEERKLDLVHYEAVDTYSPEAYERVLYDCISGDQTRFVSGDEVMAAWKFITPLLRETDIKLEIYEPGTAGPV
jgi:glucose-6-phosphate 1-dehydrogenase